MDDAIMACGEVENIFDSIEEARGAAEEVKDNEKLKEAKTHRGIQTLRRVKSYGWDLLELKRTSCAGPTTS